jgi:hypothetical protein
MTTILLYPQLEANRLVMIREMLKPMEREMKRPPAAQWEIERLSSINGRMGEKSHLLHPFQTRMTFWWLILPFFFPLQHIFIEEGVFQTDGHQNAQPLFAISLADEPGRLRHKKESVQLISQELFPFQLPAMRKAPACTKRFGESWLSAYRIF